MSGLKLLASLEHLEDFSRYCSHDKFFLGDNEGQVYTFFSNHVRKYGSLPTKEALKDQNIKLPKVEEQPEYYYDGIKTRYIDREMKKALIEAQNFINDKEHGDAVQALSTLLSEVTWLDHPGKVVNFPKQAALDILTHTKAMQAEDGEGLQFGWNTLDEMSGGLRGGDVATIVGRPGQGKTWMMLFIALHCWRQGRTPLLLSMEMAPIDLEIRLAAMFSAIPVQDLSTGEVPTKFFKRMMKDLKEIKTQHPFWIIGGGLAQSVPDLHLQVQQYAPDVVLVDAAYLLESGRDIRGKSWEEAKYVVEALKRMADELGLPLIQSHQLNRDAAKKISKKKAHELGVEDIATTDAIGQVSSLVLALLQSDEDEDVYIGETRTVTILKTRSGRHGSFRVNWQFEHGPNWLDFSESLPEDTEKITWG